MQRQVQFQTLAYDGHQHVGGYCDPYLRFDSVLRSTEEALDPQILFDPTKKKFHRPAALVQGANGQRRQSRVIGQEHQRLVRFRVLEADTTHVLWVMLATVEAVQRYGLVADNTGGSVGRARVDAPCIYVPFGAGDKEASGLMQTKQPFEVEVAAVHDIEGAWLESQDIQDVDIVEFPVADVNEARDGTAQVEHSRQYRCFSYFTYLPMSLRTLTPTSPTVSLGPVSAGQGCDQAA